MHECEDVYLISCILVGFLLQQKTAQSQKVVPRRPIDASDSSDTEDSEQEQSTKSKKKKAKSSNAKTGAAKEVWTCLQILKTKRNFESFFSAHRLRSLVICSR